jgi:topoisomerase IA-like protein
MYNIVAFSSQAKLKVDRSLPVMYWRQVVPYIRRYKEPVMFESYAEEIYNTLLAANVEDKGARRQHVQSVKQNKQRRDNAVSSGRCPKCGGKLVLREGRYGRFYGCSNYPKCNYTLNIK